MEFKKHYSDTEYALQTTNDANGSSEPTFGKRRDKYNVSKEFKPSEHLSNGSSCQISRAEEILSPTKIIPPDPTPKLYRTSGSLSSTQRDSSIITGNHIQKLNTQLLEAVVRRDVEEVVRLLGEGANPNATYRLSHVSACHIAALNGGEVLPLLLKAGANADRFDNMGRTPLHLAAWAGNAKEIALLLDIPAALQTRVCGKDMFSDTEVEIEPLLPSTYKMANVVCDTGVINLLPKTWMAGIGYACIDTTNDHIPILKPKWTPLHAASYCARAHCVRLLLAAGADPGVKDLEGHISLDVAGCAVYNGHILDSEEFTETIKLLVKAVGKNKKLSFQDVKNNCPLHTAVMMQNLEAIKLLLDAVVTDLPINTDGVIPKHVSQRKEQEEHLQCTQRTRSPIDCKDKDGFTVLHAAVRSGWVPGIILCLEAGADITEMANNGETALHEAAASGNLDVLSELLDVAKTRSVIDCLNERKETPLLTAIREGHLECVQKLLKEGASINQTLPGNVNVLHIASHNGHLDILSYFINDHVCATHKMINSPNENRRFGDTPLQCAVINNHSECVEFLLSKNADVLYDTRKGFLSSPLHIAVMNNNSKIANMILDFDMTTLNLVNCLGWTPLHTACRYASRECIKILLQRGADMSKPSAVLKTDTALSMIMNNLSKPTEFVEDIFDSCIKYRTEPIEKASVIDIDYSILAPNDGEKKQMKVINTLRNCGNRYNQKTLLLHPLVKSFLYLKWKALLPFFYTIFILYSLYVISLTILIMSVFTYKNRADTPAWMNTTVWSYVVTVALFFVVILEIIYSMNIKSKTYFLHIEFWARLTSIILGIVLVPALAVVQTHAELFRHLSTIAVLASWLEMMFLLSRFPVWGYYFMMFGTVAFKMLKILLTFTFLLIGFSLGFMIQFHSHKPFENFWSAIVKTIVMMIAEFNYDVLFKDINSMGVATIILQLIFLVFIIATAVVLMNLMIGVAVNDVQNLELIGNIKRIVKQIDLLGSLESLVYSNLFHRILPKSLNSSLQKRREIRKCVTLQLGNSFNENILPFYIIDEIFDTAFANKEQMDDQVKNEAFKAQINDIHKTVVMKSERHRIPRKDVIDPVEDTETNKESSVPCVENNIIHKMSVKIEHINMKVEAIEQTLLRIEKYFKNRRQSLMK